MNPGKYNHGPNYISHTELREVDWPLDDQILDAPFFWIEYIPGHLEEITVFLNIGKDPNELSPIQKRHLVVIFVDYKLIEVQLYKLGITSQPKLMRHVSQLSNTIVVVQKQLQ